MEFQTGDIILFQGKGFISKIIQICSRSKFSHVGIVYNSGIRQYLIHSTSLGKGKDGVRINFLDEYLAENTGTAYVKKLEVYTELGTSKQVDLNTKMWEFFTKIRDREYEKNPIEFAGAQLRVIKNKRDAEYLFCSELVVEALRAVDIMKEGKASNEYTPKDLGELDNLELFWQYKFTDPEEIPKEGAEICLN